MTHQEESSQSLAPDPSPKDSRIEAKLLEIGFSRVGSLDNGWLTLDVEIGRDFRGVYVMTLDGQVFNIGESKSVRQRLKSYAQWLWRTYDLDNERHKREKRTQERWRSLRGMERLEIYARRSGEIKLFGETVSLNKAEEEALIRRFRPLAARRPSRGEAPANVPENASR